MFKVIYTILIDLVETLVIAAAIFVVIYAFLFRPFQVNGQSMFPNYHNGEYILTNLIGLKLGKLNRGEVIVFQAPIDKDKDYIKRVIGLPGDTVMVKNGNVYVNGIKLDESSYLPPDYKTYGGSFLTEGQQITVPQNSYFVMGDNRSFSSDSREWGFVTTDKLIGKSFFVYWPLNEIKFVKKGTYNID
ncbi:MAG TPA: signal peptidase I [Patescibacteria group bacterium]|nr:signal peptidase I [Patescibacteria group bacterium]